jgi:hypothetical protein
MELATAAAATDNPDAILVPGSHCRWCKHGRAGSCDEKNRQGVEGLAIMDQAISTNSSGQTDFMAAITSGTLDMSAMDGGKLAAILDAMGPVKKLIKLADDEATKRVKADPESVPGYGLVPGRNKSEWVDDEETVEKKLRGMRLKVNDVYPKKLITPAAALKHEHFNERQLKRMKEEMIQTVAGDKKLGKLKPQADATTMFEGVVPVTTEVVTTEVVTTVAAPAPLPDFM